MSKNNLTRKIQKLGAEAEKLPREEFHKLIKNLESKLIKRKVQSELTDLQKQKLEREQKTERLKTILRKSELNKKRFFQSVLIGI